MGDWKTRLKAAALHLGISLLIAGCAAWLVFGVWYPYPYREISGESERVDATLAAVQGLHLGARPDFWQPYEQAVPRVLAASKPASELAEPLSRTGRRDRRRDGLDRTARRAPGVPAACSRKVFWTVLLDARTARVLGFVPLDSF